MNPWLILGPGGMVAVGVLSVVYWFRRSRSALMFFLFGGAVWAISVAPKFLMDYTVTPQFSTWLLGSSLGMTGFLAAMGLYVGLRTGLFECGASYVAFARTRLRGASPDEATAFGVGFGATEAIVLAVPSLMQMVAFLTNPGLVDMLPPEQRAYLLGQMSAPTWIVLAPIMERAFTLLAHLFSALLVYASVRLGRPGLFVWSVAYKSALDAAVPYLQWYLSTSTNPASIYLVEVWVVIFGVAGLVGSIRLRRELRESSLE